MTVMELREELIKYDDDAMVYIQVFNPEREEDVTVGIVDIIFSTAKKALYLKDSEL